ncbi:Ran-binding protein 9/10, partial [Tremellales sp. Uapishka_1]
MPPPGLSPTPPLDPFPPLPINRRSTPSYASIAAARLPPSGPSLEVYGAADVDTNAELDELNLHRPSVLPSSSDLPPMDDSSTRRPVLDVVVQDRQHRPAQSSSRSTGMFEWGQSPISQRALNIAAISQRALNIAAGREGAAGAASREAAMESLQERVEQEEERFRLRRAARGRNLHEHATDPVILPLPQDSITSSSRTTIIDPDSGRDIHFRRRRRPPRDLVPAYDPDEVLPNPYLLEADARDRMREILGLDGTESSSSSTSVDNDDLSGWGIVRNGTARELYNHQNRSDVWGTVDGGESASPGATLRRGRNNRRRQSARRRLEEEEADAGSWDRPTYAHEGVRVGREPTNLGTRSDPVIVKSRPREGSEEVEARPLKRRKVDVASPLSVADMPRSVSRLFRPAYLSLAIYLSPSRTLPYTFNTPHPRSRLSLTTLRTATHPPRPCITFTTTPTPNNDDKDAASLYTIREIPVECGIYYYEVEVLDKGAQGFMSVGFTKRLVNMKRLVGWEKGSWGWHGDDGMIFEGQGVGRHFSEGWGTGDTVGCGVDFRSGQAFFTKNGKMVGHCFSKLAAGIYPAVGLRTPRESIAVNFTGPFLFDISGYCQDIANQTWSGIMDTPSIANVPVLEMAEDDMGSTDSLGLPKHSELFNPTSRTSAALVLDYLQHQGYERVLALTRSEMSRRKWIEPVMHPPPALETDGSDITATGPSVESALAALRQRIVDADRLPVPWDVISELSRGNELDPVVQKRLCIHEYLLPLRLAANGKMSAEEKDQLDGRAIELGKTLLRRCKEEGWDKLARDELHEAMGVLGTRMDDWPPSLGSERRERDADALVVFLRGVNHLKQASYLQVAWDKARTQTKTLACRGDGEAAFVSPHGGACHSLRGAQWHPTGRARQLVEVLFSRGSSRQSRTGRSNLFLEGRELTWADSAAPNGGATPHPPRWGATYMKRQASLEHALLWQSLTFPEPTEPRTKRIKLVVNIPDSEQSPMPTPEPEDCESPMTVLTDSENSCSDGDVSDTDNFTLPAVEDIVGNLTRAFESDREGKLRLVKKLLPDKPGVIGPREQRAFVRAIIKLASESLLVLVQRQLEPFKEAWAQRESSEREGRRLCRVARRDAKRVLKLKAKHKAVQVDLAKRERALEVCKDQNAALVIESDRLKSEIATLQHAEAGRADHQEALFGIAKELEDVRGEKVILETELLEHGQHDYQRARADTLDCDLQQRDRDLEAMRESKLEVDRLHNDQRARAEQLALGCQRRDRELGAMRDSKQSVEAARTKLEGELLAWKTKYNEMEKRLAANARAEHSTEPPLEVQRGDQVPVASPNEPGDPATRDQVVSLVELVKWKEEYYEMEKEKKKQETVRIYEERRADELELDIQRRDEEVKRKDEESQRREEELKRKDEELQAVVQRKDQQIAALQLKNKGIFAEAVSATTAWKAKLEQAMKSNLELTRQAQAAKEAMNRWPDALRVSQLNLVAATAQIVDLNKTNAEYQRGAAEYYGSIVQEWSRRTGKVGADLEAERQAHERTRRELQAFRHLQPSPLMAIAPPPAISTVAQPSPAALTVVRPQPASRRSIGDRSPALEPRQPALRPRQPAFGSRQPALDSRQPALESRQPAVESQQPALESQHAIDESRPSARKDSTHEAKLRLLSDRLLREGNGNVWAEKVEELKRKLQTEREAYADALRELGETRKVLAHMQGGHTDRPVNDPLASGSSTLPAPAVDIDGRSAGDESSEDTTERLQRRNNSLWDILTMTKDDLETLKGAHTATRGELESTLRTLEAVQEGLCSTSDALGKEKADHGKCRGELETVSSELEKVTSELEHCRTALHRTKGDLEGTGDAEVNVKDGLKRVEGELGSRISSVSCGSARQI